jgi:hypothetical protein
MFPQATQLIPRTAPPAFTWKTAWRWLQGLVALVLLACLGFPAPLASGQAEFTYLRRHYTPSPDGDTYVPSPSPVGEGFSQTAELALMVSGFEAGSEGQVEPIEMAPDNTNYPGRIDAAGDVDTFTFTAPATARLALRVTDLAFGMRPRIRIYQGNPPALTGEYAPSLLGSSSYFYALLDAQAGESYRVEVSDQDPAASGGLFTVSAGPVLESTVEAGAVLYLPAVGR